MLVARVWITEILGLVEGDNIPRANLNLRIVNVLIDPNSSY